jgi:hypothetical protein
MVCLGNLSQISWGRLCLAFSLRPLHCPWAGHYLNGHFLVQFWEHAFLWMIETIGRWELVKGEDEGLLVWGEREREKRCNLPKD